MQSFESVKLTAMSHQADNFLDNFNGYKLKIKNKLILNIFNEY